MIEKIKESIKIVEEEIKMFGNSSQRVRLLSELKGRLRETEEKEQTNHV